MPGLIGQRSKSDIHFFIDVSLLYSCQLLSRHVLWKHSGWLVLWLLHLQGSDRVPVKELCIHTLAHDVRHVSLLGMDLSQALDAAMLAITDDEVLSMVGMDGLVITL